MNESTSESGQFVTVKDKLSEVGFSCVCPVIDNEICRRNTVKVVCIYTPLSPGGSTATLTM